MVNINENIQELCRSFIIFFMHAMCLYWKFELMNAFIFTKGENSSILWVFPPVWLMLEHSITVRENNARRELLQCAHQAASRQYNWRY